MKRQFSPTARLATFLLSAYCLASTGCSMFAVPTAHREIAESGPTQGTYTVQYRGQGSGVSKPQAYPLEASMCVSDAIKRAGAAKKFSAMKATVIRDNPSGEGRKVTMTVAFDGKSVDPKTDYALQPGDRIIVGRDDSQSMMNDLLWVFDNPF